MARLRSRLRVLMAEKGLREKRSINISIVARETNLSRPTIIKLAKDEVVQIKGEVIVIVCKYLNCTVGELLYIEE